MIIQYGKRAGGKWSTTAVQKASARIVRKSQGPVAARRFRSLKSRQRKRKRSIAKVAVKPTLVTTCLNIKASLDPDGGHARTKTVQSEARQINEVVYLEIQFLPLLFALQFVSKSSRALKFGLWCLMELLNEKTAEKRLICII